MTTAIVVLIVAALAYYVARPILNGAHRDPPEVGDRATDAHERKRAALTAIVDIESELAVGKLTREDFESLRGRYETEAVAALRDLDALHSAPESDDALEREIAALRAELACPACGGIRTAEGVCPRCHPRR